MQPDLEYTFQRNKLIPEAERAANRHCDEMAFNSEEDYRNEWSRFFHLVMDRLADERLYGRAWRR